MKKLLYSLLIISLSFTSASAVSKIERARKAIVAAKWAEGKKISDYSLIDQDGVKFSIRDYQGAPLLVSFIYTTCPDICSTIVATIAPAVEEARKEFGDVFKTLIIGFDSEMDTPEMLKEYASHHEIDFNHIRFASADAQTMEKLIKNFGFYYEMTEDGGFDHIGLVSVVNAKQVIYKQAYGINVKAEDIKIPLEQLLTGNIPIDTAPTLFEQIKAMCFKYDPETGGYVLDYAFIVGMTLQAVLMLIIVYAIFGRNINAYLSKLFRRSKK